MGRPKGSGGNSRPDRKEAMSVHTDPGDNTRYLRNCLLVSSLPPIDISDAKQVEQRINDYFRICIEDDLKPSVAGCALALGIDRKTFNRWASGEVRATTHSPVVKKARDILTTMMENYMMNGKINPVAGIFLMKNNHGYTDQQEVVVKPSNPLGDETPADQLQQKYLEQAGVEVLDSAD